MVIMFIGIILIFLNAITSSNGSTWLEVIWNFITSYWTSSAVAALIFIILVVLFMIWIVGGFGKGSDKTEEKMGGH